MALRTIRDGMGGTEALEVSLVGQTLLDCALLNKGTAFSEGERRELGLLGLLPPQVETLEEQVARAYEEYRAKDSDLERHIFLRSLQDTNEVLFYRLLQEHIAEMTRSSTRRPWELLVSAIATSFGDHVGCLLLIRSASRSTRS